MSAGIRKVLHLAGGKCSGGAPVLNAGSGDMTPPRSLGRCAPAVRLWRALPALTRQAHDLSTETGEKAPNNMCTRRGEGRAGGVFP